MDKTQYLINTHKHINLDHPINKNQNLHQEIINYDYYDLYKYFNKDQELIINFLKSSSNYFSLGFHPYEYENYSVIKDLFFECLSKIKNINNLIFIGEIGLDYSIQFNKLIMQSIFEEILINTININKPYITHCVRAFNDMISIYKKLNSSPIFIFHDYMGNIDTTKQLIKNKKFYYSFSPRFIKNMNQNKNKILNTIPMEKILLETDDFDVTINKWCEEFCNLFNIKKADLINENFIFYNSILSSFK